MTTSDPEDDPRWLAALTRARPQLDRDMAPQADDDELCAVAVASAVAASAAVATATATPLFKSAYVWLTAATGIVGATALTLWLTAEPDVEHRGVANVEQGEGLAARRGGAASGAQAPPPSVGVRGGDAPPAGAGVDGDVATPAGAGARAGDGSRSSLRASAGERSEAARAGGASGSGAGERGEGARAGRASGSGADGRGDGSARSGRASASGADGRGDGSARAGGALDSSAGAEADTRGRGDGSARAGGASGSDPGAAAARSPVDSALAGDDDVPGGASAASLFGAANAARRAGAHEDAAASYRELLRKFPRSREAKIARVALGRLLLERLKKPAEALAQFDAYLKASPAGASAEDALVGRARALSKLGRDAAEASAWQRLLAKYPGSVHAARARKRIEELGPP